MLIEREFGTMITWTDEQIAQWCLALSTYREDADALAQAGELQVKRHQARQAMLLHLQAFLDGCQTLQEFNTVFQQQTHYDWNVFGMRGTSGGMFLNKLVKYIPYDEQLAQQLRSALPIPRDVRDGQHWMQALVLFLEGMIATNQVSRSELQPARLPFFLSAWWHLQDEEQWPRFASHLRQIILDKLPLADPAMSQIDLYFAYRERFLALKSSFQMSSWELEHFLTWQEQLVATEQPREKVRPTKSPSSRSGRGQLPNNQDRSLYLQWLLAQIGRQVGCQVWIAQQNHEKSWNGDLLGQFSLPTLPQALEADVQAQLNEIDLLWLRKNEVVAAYQIAPKQMGVAADLLRLYDLGLACTKRQPYLCLVLPQQLLEQVSVELSRPLFQRQKGRQRWLLIREEDLAENGEHIRRWASHHDVIERLAFSPEQEKELVM
jgi:hypothetical protein